MTNTTKTEITWNTDDMPMAQIRAHYAAFGAWGLETLTAIIRAGAVHCSSRAHGCWMANEREAYARFRSLANHINAGTALTSEVR